MKTLLPMLFLLISSEIVFSAGPRVGNGGMGWLCQSSEGDINWIQLIDLFEAENEFGYSPHLYQSDSFQHILNEVKQRLNRVNYYYASNFDTHLAVVLNNMVFIDHVLATTDDLSIRVRPDFNDCLSRQVSRVQIANFTEDGRLLVRRKYWKYLNDVNKAALVVHETVYLIFRSLYGDIDSDRSRKTVGILFSDFDDKRLKELLDIELAGGNGIHIKPLDNNALPFILADPETNRYINQILDEYCRIELPGRCSDQNYFKMSLIKPGEGQVTGSFDRLAIRQTYNFEFSLPGTNSLCTFDIEVIERRINGVSRKSIGKKKSNCSAGQ